jgi:hypothetical protein
MSFVVEKRTMSGGAIIRKLSEIIYRFYRDGS